MYKAHDNQSKRTFTVLWVIHDGEGLEHKNNNKKRWYYNSYFLTHFSKSKWILLTTDGLTVFVEIVHSCQRLLDIFGKISAIYHVLDQLTPHHLFHITFHNVFIDLKQNWMSLQLVNPMKKPSVKLNWKLNKEEQFC